VTGRPGAYVSLGLLQQLVPELLGLQQTLLQPLHLEVARRSRGGHTEVTVKRMIGHPTSTTTTTVVVVAVEFTFDRGFQKQIN